MKNTNGVSPDDIVQGYWYAVCASGELSSHSVLGVTRFGLPLALWRKQNGEPACLEARCPHRGADLRLGRREDDAIRCLYHGLKFDACGRCLDVPFEAEGGQTETRRAITARKYESRDHHGLVWVWWGSDATSYPAVPWPRSVPDGHPRVTRSLVFRTGLARVMENLLDHIHVPILHGYQRKSRVLSHSEVTNAEAEIKTTSTLTRPDGTHPVTYVTCCSFPALAFIYGEGCTTVYTAVPIHDGATLVLSTYISGTANPVLGKIRAWSEAYWEEKEIWADDLKLLAGLPEAAERGSHLTRGDRAIAAWYAQAKRARSLVLDWNEVHELDPATLETLGRGQPQYRDWALRPFFKLLVWIRARCLG